MNNNKLSRTIEFIMIIMIDSIVTKKEMMFVDENKKLLSVC